MKSKISFYIVRIYIFVIFFKTPFHTAEQHKVDEGQQRSGE